MPRPSVLFVCVHNSGRSQMASALMSHISQGAVQVRSAGSVPANQVNPAVMQAMAELGIDIAAETPRILTEDAVRYSDVVITMGCGDACPFYPGKRYEDWVLDDPAGKAVDAVRPIRDEIPTGSRPCSTSSSPPATADAGEACGCERDPQQADAAAVASGPRVHRLPYRHREPGGAAAAVA